MAQITLNSTGVASSGTLALQSNGTTTAVTIDTSQNVGIGTASPNASYKMSITGNSASIYSGILFTDTNAGGGVFSIYGESAALKFRDSSAGATRMVIDSSGNVGIGTSSPDGRLHVHNGTAGSVTPQANADELTVENNANAGISILSPDANVASIYFGSPASAFNAQIESGYNAGAPYLKFNTNAVERMRIDSSGNVGIGTSSPNAVLDVVQPSASANGGRVAYFRSAAAGDVANNAVIISKFDNNTTTSQIFMKFEVNNTTTSCGRINANGANTAAFGSTSDRRVKENIVDLPPQLANIMALRPVEFDYVESYGGGHQIGFVAQEVQAIYPDLVGEAEDGMLTLTDMNKNDARLIKAIQEMKAIIDTQASTITSLTDRITALEAK